MESKSARLQLIPTLGKGKANVQDLDSFALTTTDLALSHWLHEFCTLLLVARLCLPRLKLLIIGHIIMDRPFVNGPIC